MVSVRGGRMKKLVGGTISFIALLAFSAPAFATSIWKTSLGAPMTAAFGGSEGAVYDAPSLGIQVAGPGQSGAVFLAMYPVGMPSRTSFTTPALGPIQPQSLLSSNILPGATVPASMVAQQPNADPVVTQTLATLGGGGDPAPTFRESVSEPVANPEPA